METERHDSGTTDRQYQEGMAHLQAGEWQKAITCFEELEHTHPDSQVVQRALADAQFRAGLDEDADLKVKRWSIPWRPIMVRASILALIVVVAVIGAQIIRNQVVPALAETQEKMKLEQLETEGNALLRSGDHDDARARYQALLAAVPNHQGAIEGLTQIEEDQEIDDLYEQAVAAQESGDNETALALFTQISDRKPAFRNINLRIEEINQKLERDNLFAAAEADYESGRLTGALSKYEQFAQQYTNDNSDHISGRIFALNLLIGRDLVEHDPPAAENVSQALDYFDTALALEPRNTEAELEQRLAEFFLQGQDRFQEALWDEAIDRLRAVYDLRPTYHRGTVANRLYAAYIQSGDQLADAGDYFFAYERYRQAASLLVEDRSLAQGRLSETMLQLTPTPVPTATPTPTPTPKPTKKPKAKPKATQVPKLAPTNTPAATPVPEFPWTGEVGYSLTNCGVTQLKGFMLDRSNHLLGDIWLHYWAEGFEGAWTQSEWFDPGINTPYEGDERNWEFAIDGYAKDGVWRVCVVPFYGQTDCISNIVSAATSSDCESGIQVVHIIFRQN